jgi:excisionase family DNA binding protein
MTTPVNAHNDAQFAQVQVQQQPLVVGYTEAAEFLGLSARTLERYVREGRIPMCRCRGAARGRVCGPSAIS